MRDGGNRFGGFDVMIAVTHVRDEIAPALVGRPADDQAAIDATLIALDGTPNKARLGGNAMIATSMAAAKACALRAANRYGSSSRGDSWRAALCQRSRSLAAARMRRMRRCAGFHGDRDRRGDLCGRA